MRKNGAFLRTRFEWIKVIEEMSPAIACLDLTRALDDEVYKADGQPATNKDAFNFANCRAHSTVLADTIEKLSARGVQGELVKKFVVDLTGRNIYGTFCELAAYDFLDAGNHDFGIQVPVTGSDILNPNGSDLDGVVRLGSEEMYFDAKAFGFTEHLANRLVERLSDEFQPKYVQVQDSLDVPLQLLNDLLGKDYGTLRDELVKSGMATRGAMRFTVHPPANIRISIREANPATLASENADYAFRYAKQFVRRKPFFLIFVIHPWVSTLRLHNNFGGAVDAFTTKFAEQTFTRFRSDATPTFDVTRGVASDLLSGIIFIDAWRGSPPREMPWFRCFINPHAMNPLSDEAMEAFAAPYGDMMRVIKF